MIATLTHESGNRWTLRWLPRHDFVQIERISGADLEAALDRAVSFLDANGMDLVSVEETPNGNATLVVAR